MSLTKSQIQAKYPEVYESYSLQASVPESKYIEKMKFWENSSINCFERWTIPYFLEREKEKKRPCLRLNYPPDGKCNDCLKGTCRYDKICFMCGQEGHGAFQSFPGGKLKGELKCAKHRNFLSQLGMIRLQHGIDEEGLKVLFKLPGYQQIEKPASVGAGKKVAKAATAAAGTTEAATAKGGAANTTGKATAAPTAAAAATASAAETNNAAPASTDTASANAKGVESQQAALTAAIGAEVSKVAQKPGKAGANASTPAPSATIGTNAVTTTPTGSAVGKAVTPTATATHSAALLPATTPSPGPVAANVSPSMAGLNGNWQLNLDGGAQNLSGLGSALLGGGSALNYDSLLGSGAFEDNGRRPWAATGNVASSSSDSALLGPMAGLLPAAPGAAQAQLPQGSRLNGMHLGAGVPPMPPLTTNAGLLHGNGSLLPGLSGGLGLMPGFDALSLGSAVPPGAGAGGATPQAGFGSTLAGLQLPLAGALGANAAAVAAMQALQAQQFQQVFEVVDVDEYVAPGTLRVTLNSLVADHTGAFTTKGAYLTHRGVQEVTVRCWRRPSAGTPGAVAAGAATGAGPAVDMAALRAEIRALRTLSRRTVHASRILHHGALELSHHPTGDFLGLLSDSSELGTLDRFAALQAQIATAAANATSPTTGASAGGGANAAHVMAFPVSDLQSMCVQLIEGLIQCHELNIRHRDIRPANILVARCTDELSSRQFHRGLVLKYTNFVPTALLPLCHHTATSDTEQERWLAPEVDFDARRNGTRFQAGSDVWSLGLTIYYLASGGHLPFDNHKQAVEAAANPDYRRQCLEKHGLHERLPMLYDLVERLVRPAYMRTDLQIIRCHPFLWTMETRRHMLIQFANSTMVRNSDTINALVTGIDKISPLYVFGADGWVPPMAPFLAALIPAKIKQELGWSGTYLLQAIKSQISYPELLTQSVYPRMTPHQATHAYIRQITDVDFPRLLILLYELGGIHGKWLWDGDEISHSWN